MCQRPYTKTKCHINCTLNKVMLNLMLVVAKIPSSLRLSPVVIQSMYFSLCSNLERLQKSFDKTYGFPATFLQNTKFALFHFFSWTLQYPCNRYCNLLKVAFFLSFLCVFVFFMCVFICVVFMCAPKSALRQVELRTSNKSRLPQNVMNLPKTTI